MKASPFNSAIHRPVVIRIAAASARGSRGHVALMARGRNPNVAPVTLRERVASASRTLKVQKSRTTP
ncbi:hypothetical protein ASE85_06570 [Sphingobium sp. Leaf26]|nr:hypothetical protein ASE85_06570 [Sphingobium sp. Leaf26]